ncbi:hypothetical protein [Nocardioides taihuensis]|uniref:Uncharacterized protein n=1 Tax=Nocardioides taihuensis TaxID=1835606 RepID=A0ABW0BD61_9ACTN
MIAVLVALAFTAAVAELLGTALIHEPASSRPVTGAQGGTALSVLPTPTQSPPQARVDAAHRALHATSRACRQPLATRGSASVRRPVEVMEQFARDYPNGGFTIDDEPATTLSLLVVLRYELQNCEPILVPGVEELLPGQFRDPS